MVSHQEPYKEYKQSKPMNHKQKLSGLLISAIKTPISAQQPLTVSVEVL